MQKTAARKMRGVTTSLQRTSHVAQLRGGFREPALGRLDVRDQRGFVVRRTFGRKAAFCVEQRPLGGTDSFARRRQIGWVAMPEL